MAIVAIEALQRSPMPFLAPPAWTNAPWYRLWRQLRNPRNTLLENVVVLTRHFDRLNAQSRRGLTRDLVAVWVSNRPNRKCCVSKVVRVGDACLRSFSPFAKVRQLGIREQSAGKLMRETNVTIVVERERRRREVLEGSRRRRREEQS